MSGRRARIRAPRKSTSVEVDFDKSWELLSMAIGEIHQKNASRLSFEELYRTAYTLVLRKFGKRLYDAVINIVNNHLEGQVVPTLVPLINNVQSNIPTGNPVELLKATKKCWDDHCLCMRMISDILMYLDRVYSKEARVPLMYDAGLTLFRDAVIRNGRPSIGINIYEVIIAEIQKERSGEIIDKMAIKQAVHMLESLPESRLDGDSLYSMEFEPRLQQASKEYFENAATRLLEDNNDAAAYIRKVVEWLDAEDKMCNLYLSEESTLPKLMSTVEKVLIVDRIKRVMEIPERGLGYWIDNDRFEELTLLFDLISRVSETHDELKEMIHLRVLESGRTINLKAVRAQSSTTKQEGSNRANKTTISIQWVEDVLELKSKYDKIVKICFGRNKGIHSTIDNAFSIFVNEDTKDMRAAEFLSLFIDEHLKKSLKGKSEQEIEDILDKAIILFRYISDKDLFENYYQKQLAKRLLNAKSISDDAERNMIGKIKMEVGTSFTSKLEGMFKDMKVSQDLMTDFKNTRQSGALSTDIDISVNVLTSTSWPSSAVSSETRMVLPIGVEKSRETFERFYLSRHNGRKLSWNLNIGTADVRARFKKRTHEINMPTAAMVILLLFNDIPEGESLTFDEIQDLTTLPKNDLIRHLQSISIAPKTRLLKKEPMSRDIKPSDRFFFNDKFDSNMARIKVFAISSGGKTENENERKEAIEQVDQSRRYEADAAIVRIMKARKTMEHANLVAEVTRQLANRFKPDPSTIKQRIDTLLEREYIERDPDKHNVYNYLA